MQSTHRLIVWIVGFVCVTALAITVLLIRDDDDSGSSPGTSDPCAGLPLRLRADYGCPGFSDG